MEKENKMGIPSNTYQVKADKSVLDYLRPNSPERASRMDAYCDLLDRAAEEGQTDVVRFGTTVHLYKGQSTVTISELAKFWKWHRVTTRAFLNTLESLGLAQINPYGKFFVVTMNYAASSVVGNPPCFQSEEQQRLTRWICGYIGLEELMDTSVTFFNDTDSLFAPKMADGQSSAGNRLHLFLSHLILHQAGIFPADKDVLNALAKLFTEHCSRDFSQFWNMLSVGGLDFLLKGKSAPQLDSAKFSDEAAGLLATIFAYYANCISKAKHETNNQQQSQAACCTPIIALQTKYPSSTYRHKIIPSMQGTLTLYDVAGLPVSGRR